MSTASSEHLSSLVTLLLFAGAAGLLAAGCSSKLDPTDPGEAYMLYRDAVLNDNVDGIWKRTAPSTREYFQERYEQLAAMDKKIRKYLPHTDHEVARKQTGAELLDEIDGGEGLFKKVVEPKNLNISKARKLGSLIETIRKSKDGKKAQVVTRSGRKYRMVKGGEGEWHVALVKSLNGLDKSFQWLDRNRKALTKTVNDRLESEREEREEIIAELMDVEEQE